MSKNIIIYLRDYKKGTGGFASIVELSNSLRMIGYNVKFISTSFSLLTIRDFFKPQNNLINVGGIFDNLIFNKFSIKKINLKILIKILLSTVYTIFNYKYFKNYFKTIKNSDLIIFTLPLSYKNINIIRELSINSKLIYNHAGSVYAFQNYWLKDLLKFQNKSKKSVYELFFDQFDFMLFQSKDQSIDCANKYPKFKSKIRHLNPTANEFEISNAFNFSNPYDDNCKIIVNVGTICERKNQLLTIKAFNNLTNVQQNAQLHFVGDTSSDYSYYKILKDYVLKNHLENKIFFHGLKNDYLRYMVHSDLVVLSSKAEGMPRILREAMFMKKPIVASYIEGNIELIGNGNGILIHNESSVDYSQAFFKILNDSNFADKISKLAHKTYIKKYSNIQYNLNLKTIFNKLNNNNEF